MKARVHVFVSGTVQGVFFRSEANRLAHRCNVTGWIRNLSDGRVEAVFEGDARGVDRLVEFCRRGPPGADVSNTEVRTETYAGEFKDFRIVW